MFNMFILEYQAFYYINTNQCFKVIFPLKSLRQISFLPSSSPLSFSLLNVKYTDEMSSASACPVRLMKKNPTHRNTTLTQGYLLMDSCLDVPEACPPSALEAETHTSVDHRTGGLACPAPPRQDEGNPQGRSRPLPSTGLTSAVGSCSS